MKVYGEALQDKKKAVSTKHCTERQQEQRDILN